MKLKTLSMVRESREKKFNWESDKPRLILAPMAGITDQPFRLICKSFGADVLFSEMISSEAIYFNLKANSQKPKASLIKTLNLIKFSEAERPFIVQIFGSDPQKMAFAAEYIASGEWAEDFRKSSKLKVQMSNKAQSSNVKNLDFGFGALDLMSIPDGIDINMGCPNRDVIKQGAGATLIRNPKLAEKIVQAVKKKIEIPLSVKTRIGWKDNKDILTFSKMLKSVGVDTLTIHGRTVAQGFSGPVDWQTICKVKKALKIPVIGNGGINENLKLKISNLKLDGLMIGRGALGNPWIFQKLKTKKEKGKSKEVLIEERKKIVFKHSRLAEKLKGKQGIVEMRKHLAWYFRGQPHASKIRSALVQVNTFQDIQTIMDAIKDKEK